MNKLCMSRKLTVISMNLSFLLLVQVYIDVCFKNVLLKDVRAQKFPRTEFF